MRRFYVAGSGILLVLCLGIALWGQSERLRAADRKIAALEQQLLQADQVADIEYRTQTLVRDIHIKSAEVQAHVATVPDPECKAPEALLDAWRSGLDGLRQTAGAAAQPAADGG